MVQGEEGEEGDDGFGGDIRILETPWEEVGDCTEGCFDGGDS